LRSMSEPPYELDWIRVDLVVFEFLDFYETLWPVPEPSSYWSISISMSKFESISPFLRRLPVTSSSISMDFNFISGLPLIWSKLLLSSYSSSFPSSTSVGCSIVFMLGSSSFLLFTWSWLKLLTLLPLLIDLTYLRILKLLYELDKSRSRLAPSIF